MMAGMMKLDSSRSSTTLQGMRAAFAAAATAALTARSLVAATTSHLPSMSAVSNTRARCVIAPRATRLGELGAELRRHDGDHGAGLA